MPNRAGGVDTGTAIALTVAGLVVGSLIVIASGGGFGSKCVGVLSADMSEVLDANAYPWNRFQDDVAKAGGLDDKAQHDHPLKDKNGNDANVTADIFRINNKSGSRKASCFDDKVVVVGLIYPRADFADLHLKGAANNYLVVWHNTSEDPDPEDNPNPTSWHGAILNGDGRNPIPFTYKSHPKQDPKQDSDTDPPGNLNDPYKKCWKDQQRACFGELQASAPPPPPAPGLGFGLGLSPLREGGGSEPWISCAQYGCCCGGTGCHTDM
jgi:hypothetical protein